MKRLRTLCAAALLALAGTAPAAPAARPDIASLDYKLQARALAPGVWVVEGANADFEPANGCNIINTGFIATGAGVLVVNTGPSLKYGQQLRALIERTAGEPVKQVIHLNLHPDYFLGNQAFADVPRLATPVTRAGMAREATAYEDNLYRMCGDWMKGTQALLPDADIAPGTLRLGQREFELREYQGHTDSDLVLVDRASGVVFAGGLVFVQRIPTTPHARLPEWQRSLQALEQQLPPQPDPGAPAAGKGLAALVPSHGPVRADTAGIVMTRRYLDWLDATLQRAATQGLEMSELLRQPLPAEFDGWAARATEYTRNVVHLYPRYEQAALLPACDSKARAGCANLGQLADKP
ncbi:quinoprotein relay system zinc metallohydrolase 1 [Azohydromonas caseinilytica]|uniref:Quinoprotein relay system zinc metallohydrolase 1 n=1 Tax=Azohydromonas caseinilytica TaxID=2728836 RepID=A0A848F978_9BURK|nr:quinoprotein relay system zinc metallohydrolase 1 [Azohydromonas caseinilytica]NML15039.1 quinoprotein relay system zinc metallohydrolase 1 [Azohydromonas caseinilytica]